MSVGAQVLLLQFFAKLQILGDDALVLCIQRRQVALEGRFSHGCPKGAGHRGAVAPKHFKLNSSK